MRVGPELDDSIIAFRSGTRVNTSFTGPRLAVYAAGSRNFTGSLLIYWHTGETFTGKKAMISVAVLFFPTD